MYPDNYDRTRVTEPPAKVLDLSSPADALRLAAHAFAAEVTQRAQPGRRPFIIVTINVRPYLQNEPAITYSINDLYGTDERRSLPTPEAALAVYLAYDPDEGEQETAS